MKIILLPGSLRKDSLNKKLLNVVRTLLPSEHDVEFVDLQPLALPVYDGDVEASQFPAAVNTLGDKIKQAQALVICSPEYNGSISSPLKNTLDWLSRLKPHPIGSKPTLLMSASPGALGGIRGLLHTRVPLDSLGAFVYPQTFGLSKAHEAFNAQGALIDIKTQERIVGLLKDFLIFSQKQ